MGSWPDGGSLTGFVSTMMKRLVVGRPLRSDHLDDTLLPKKIALPVFCSDPLSSNAYATEEILKALSLGGLAMLVLSPWIALAVTTLLIVVVASYRQTCRAYPTGGGAYAVSRANLGRNASLVAASALLVDYVLTVAVSVAAGVANVTSAFPALQPHAVALSLGCVAVLAVMNLRGVKESGTVFAVPTYGFIAMVFLMIGTGLLKVLSGDAPVAETAAFGIAADHQTTGWLAVALMLRAFSQGCTALTGVEAVSNGVPNFKPPKDRNAMATLSIMGGITVAMFAGITWLAVVSNAKAVESPAQWRGAPDGYVAPTVIFQEAAAVFGGGAALTYLLAGFTAAILILAANTAFNGFPILASLLGRDGYLPKQFARRGDRLVFSNGIVILAVLTGLLIWAYHADVSKLIQLYIIGVFVSFTLSQAGMVRHWSDELGRTTDRTDRLHIRRSQAINGIGAAFTAVVLVVVLVTKFTHGAYLVCIAMPLLFILMKAISRHYRRVRAELAPEPGDVLLPSRIHALVLVSTVHKPTLRAIAYARATRPDQLTALAVATGGDNIDRLREEWAAHGISIPLTVLESPYRDITRPVLDHVARIRRASPGGLVVVYIPEYVVGRWWEHLLHNQSALRLKARLLFLRGVMVTNVPWQLESSRDLIAQDTLERVGQPSPR
jgi:amino acid transporter